MQKLTRLMAGIGLSCALFGCSSVHLYNKAADTAATSAKDDYEASKLTESVKSAYTVLDALDNKEIEAFRSANQAERNLELLALVSEGGTSKKRTTDDGILSRFNNLVDARLTVLSGVNTNAAADSNSVAKAEIEVRDAERKENLARAPLSALQAAFTLLPSCDMDVAALKDSTDTSKAIGLLKSPPPNLGSSPISEALIFNIKNVGQQCEAVLTARNKLTLASSRAGGQLNVAAVDLNRIQSELATQQQAAKEEAAKLKAAASALAVAQKAIKDSPSSVDLTCKASTDAAEANPTAVAAPAAASAAAAPGLATGRAAAATAKDAKLCDAIEKLRKMGDFGIKALNEERLEQLNAILGALGGDDATSNDPDLQTGLAILSTTSRFSQALKQYQQVGKLPPLEPLLIDKQLTAAQLAAAQAGTQLAKARVQYAQDYLDATKLEVTLLVQAKAEMAGIGRPSPTGTVCPPKPTAQCASLSQLQEDKSLGRSAEGAGETGSRKAYRALALLSESYSVARDRQRTAELRLIDSQYRESLIKSEAALASWNTLLSIPINSLKAYHADGVTTAEAASLVAQVVQALATVGIAINIK